MSSKEYQDAIELIGEACEILGWDISFSSDGDVDYMVIGMPDSVERITALINADVKEPAYQPGVQ